MKKVMLLAAMLAMMLVAAAPAFAQQAATSQYGDVTQQQCANILGDINVNPSNAAVIGQYGNDDLAAIAQENNTSINVVQNCVNAIGSNVATGGINGGGQVTVPPGTVVQGVPLADTNGNGVVSAAEAQNQGVTAAAVTTAAGTTAATTVLPDTGGASLFALGAGTLLVAGGLLARRIVR